MAMTSKSELLQEYYEALASGDAQKMTSFYHRDIVFKDPVFGSLSGERVSAMWKMLLQKGVNDLSIQYSELQEDDDRGSAKWTASYPFGPEKRKVVNHIVSTFHFRNGKIISQTDHFDLWKWSRQAIGLKGYLLGWTDFMKQKIRVQSSIALSKYMHKTN